MFQPKSEAKRKEKREKRKENKKQLVMKNSFKNPLKMVSAQWASVQRQNKDNTAPFT